MKRIVGTLLTLGGVLLAPPLWAGTASGGLRPWILFAGAVASIVTGLILSLSASARAGGSSVSTRPPLGPER